MKDDICCFTGHRDLPYNTADLQKKLDCLLEELVANGYGHFISGGAIGFDTLAAQSVLRLKEKHPEVQLHMALPCPDQDKYWSYEKRREYHSVLEQADSTRYVCPTYTKYCMLQRNRIMVENSSLVIAYYNGKGTGGTAMTVKYAQQKGIKTINLY